MDNNISKMDGKRACNGVNKLGKKSCVVSFFKSFEALINDKKTKYADKVQNLLSAWNILTPASSESPQPEFDVLFINTLKFVLRADWLLQSMPTRTHLSFSINKFTDALNKSKLYPSILHQCRVLEAVVKNPWEHSQLKKILDDQEEVEFFDLLDFFQLENGKVLVVRLEMMLESRCEDMVAVLSKRCLQTYYNSDALELDMTQDEVDYITDIYYCCLLRLKKTNELTDEIKTFELDEGLDLLRRYRKNNGVGAGFNDNCKDARVWKYSKKVIGLVANTLIANALLHDDLIDNDTILQDLITEWAYINRSNPEEDFSPVALEMIRKFVMIARSSKCIYPFCLFLIENCGSKELNMNYVATCIVRAINQNMNEIEQYRVNDEGHKLRETYDQLSKGFELISKLLGENVNIYKECLLTSFSLTPSNEGLEKLETLIDTLLSKPAQGEEESLPEVAPSENSDANLSQVPVQDDTPTDALPATDEAGNKMNVTKVDLDQEIETKAQLNDVADPEPMKGAATAYCAEVERLQLDESIKIDLNSILRYQRFHKLSWELEWSELKVNCEKYLEAFQQRGGFDQVELKYLDLDYNQFKDCPIDDDEYIGIEKGYEHCMVLSPVWSEAEEDLPLADRRRPTSGDTDKENEYGRAKKRRISHSSDEEWSNRKSKKVLKKAKKQPAFVEYDDPSDVDELLEFVREFEIKPPNSENEKEKVAEKKKKKISNAGSAAEAKDKKKRGRPSHSSKIRSENSADSQSENQPPDYLDSLSEENLLSSKSPLNNLHKLRQFRIKAEPEENVDVSKGGEEADLKPRIAMAPESNVLKLCIPKCDNEIAKRNGFDDNAGTRKANKAKKTKSATATPRKSEPFADVDDMFKCEVRLSKTDVNAFFQSSGATKNRVKKVSDEERIQNLNDELLSFLNDSFENSAAIAATTITTQPLESLTTQSDASLKVRIKKPNKRNKKSKTGEKSMDFLDTCGMNNPAASLSMPELQNSLSNLYDDVSVSPSVTSASCDEAGATNSKDRVKKLPDQRKNRPNQKAVRAFLAALEERSDVSPKLEESVSDPPDANSTSNQTCESSASVNGRPKKKGQNTDKNVVRVKRVRSKKVTELQDDHRLQSSINVKSVCDESAALACKSGLQQPLSSITQVKSEPDEASTSTSFPRSYLSTTSSYLNTPKMADKGTNCCIPREMNAVPSDNRLAGTVAVNHTSPLIAVNGTRLTDLSECVTSPVDNRVPVNAFYSMAESSSSQVANSFNSTQCYSSTTQLVTPASRSMPVLAVSNCTTPSLLNTCGGGSNSSEFSPSYYTSFNEPSVKPSPKLRSALQNTSVCGDELYPMQTINKQSAVKQHNSEVNTVHKILGEYTQTLVKYPELKNVPAPRNRSATNGAITPKRQRKCKNGGARNEITTTPAVQMSSVPNSYLTQACTPNHVINQYSSPVSVASASQISSVPNSANQYALPQFSNLSQFLNQPNPTFSQSTGVATPLVNHHHHHHHHHQESWMQNGGSTVNSCNGMVGNGYSQVPVSRNSSSYFVDTTSNGNMELVNVLVEDSSKNSIKVQSHSPSMLCIDNGTSVQNSIMDLNEDCQTNNNQYTYNLLIDSGAVTPSESSPESTNELKTELLFNQQSDSNLMTVYKKGVTIYVRQDDGEGSAQINIPENSTFSESMFSDFFPSIENNSIGTNHTIEISNDVRELLYQNTNYGDQMPTYGS